MAEEMNTQKPDSEAVDQQQACSALSLAGKLAMLGDNVKRFYDLCLLVHESKEEMKLLDQQFVDITNDAIAEDAVEWFMSGRDVTAQREWEAAHPGWRCTGTGIRKCKQNKD